MTKTDFIKEVTRCTESEYTQKEVAEVLATAQKVLTDTLASGEKVQIVGFGTFEVRERAERTGRNPQTGKTMTIAATKSPAFKAGKAFKDAIKNS